MTEHTHNASELAVVPTIGDIDKLVPQIFHDPQIDAIWVYPPSKDEWRIHMPNLLAMTGYRDKRLECVTIQPFAYGIAIGIQVWLVFHDKEEIRFDFNRTIPQVSFAPPPSTKGNLFRARTRSVKDVTGDEQGISAFKEVLDYVLLVKEMDQLSE